LRIEYLLELQKRPERLLDRDIVVVACEPGLGRTDKLGKLSFDVIEIERCHRRLRLVRRLEVHRRPVSMHGGPILRRRWIALASEGQHGVL
jgi:hypothetical protein